jgi:hypothetical protein
VAAATSDPLVANSDFDRQQLARAASPGDVQSMMLDYIAARRRDIGATRRALADKPTMIYGLDVLLEASYQAQNIGPGSLRLRIIRDHMDDIHWAEAIPQLVLGVIAFAAGLLTAGGGTVAVLGAAAALGIGAYQAVEEFRRYEVRTAARGAQLTSDDPTMAWVVIAVIGAGFDAAALVSVLPKIRPAIQAFNAGAEAGDVASLGRKLDRLADVEQGIKDGILRAAEAEAEARAAWRAILRPPAALRMVIVPGAEEFGRFVYAVYLSVKRGIRDFQVFVRTNEAVAIIGDVAKLNADDLAKLKTGYAVAVKEMETVAARGKALGMSDGEISSFMGLRADTKGMTAEQLGARMDAWTTATGAGGFKWGNPRSRPTYGHTFLDHTGKLKSTQLVDRARALGHQVGQWTDDELAARLIADVAKRGPGTHEVGIAAGIGRAFMPDGTELVTDMARVVVKPDGSVRTAFPFSSLHPN